MTEVNHGSRYCGQYLSRETLNSTWIIQSSLGRNSITHSNYITRYSFGVGRASVLPRAVVKTVYHDELLSFHEWHAISSICRTMNNVTRENPVGCSALSLSVVTGCYAADDMEASTRSIVCSMRNSSLLDQCRQALWMFVCVCEMKKHWVNHCWGVAGFVVVTYVLVGPLIQHQGTKTDRWIGGCSAGELIELSTNNICTTLCLWNVCKCK